MLTFLFTVILAAFLTGCDPSSDDNPELSITKTTPLNRVTGVPIQSAVSAIFSTDADLSTLTTATFTLTAAAGPVTGTITYNAADKKVTFSPVSPLGKITLYTATLTTGIKDTNGTALSAAYTWTFTTGPLISAKEDHTLILKSDGTLWSCGLNDYGQLGDGSLIDRSTPVQVTGLTGAPVSSAAAGSYHSIALRSDGTVLAWGENGDGQLGDGNPSWAHGLGPVQAKGLTGITALAAGYWHSLALKNDGSVWAWGANGKGQLGNGTYDEQSVPMQVSGLAGITAIAAGTEFTLALKSDGTVWAWGDDTYGQLGDNNDGSVETYRNAPVPVSGLTGISAISAGYDHSLFLKNDGTVWTCGRNDTLQCGVPYDNAVNNGHILVPVQVASLSGITAIAAGGWHNLVLKSDGAVWAWGSNYYRSLGSSGNSDVNYETPVQTSSLTTGTVTAVAAGLNHSLALMSDGSVWTWGDNGKGQLGDTTILQNDTPEDIGVY